MQDQLSKDIAALGDADALRQVLHETCELTGMGFAAIAFVNEDRWIACQVDDRIEFGLDPGQELEVRKTICDDIRACKKAVVIDDVTRDPDWWSHPVPVLYGFKSYVSLPIILADGRFFGTLCAIDPEPRSDRLADKMDQLQSLADRVASCLGERMAEADPLAGPSPTLA